MNPGTDPLRQVFYSRRAVTVEGVRPAAVTVEDGRIAAVETRSKAPPGGLDLGDAALLPGLVDSHVHVNEPGRGHWEGFDTASRAAAAGGITTFVDMPLNSSPVTTSVAALTAKLRVAQGVSRVDFALWGGLVPGAEGEVASLLEAGAAGIKCFLCPSGLDEFPAVGAAELDRALPLLAACGGVLLAHAEDPAFLGNLEPAEADPRSYRAYLASRPPEAEVAAIELLVDTCRRSGAAIHVVHVTSAQALELLASARREGLPLSAETCPHYLTFSAEEIPEGATAFKCAPPIRERRHREALWRALQNGVLDLVATDHSPCPPEMKAPETGSFSAAWGGISSLQLLLAATWTGARERGFGLEHLARWLSAAPAHLAGVNHRKGALAVGQDADLVVFRPEDSFIVRGCELEHRHPLTPYEGRRLYGRVEQTYLRGELVFDRGAFPGEPRGVWLRREIRHPGPGVRP